MARNKANIINAIDLTPLAALDDAEIMQILTIRNEDAVRRNMYTNHIISTQEHRAWVNLTQQRSDVAFYAVRYNGPIVGAISLDRLDTTNLRTDWAFYLSADTQGQGLGSALEFKFLDYVFGPRGMRKLNCEVLSFNTPVIGLHKKFGFQQEGIRRAHIRRGSSVHDTVLLGILDTEWQAARPALAQAFGVTS